jgi:protein HOOK3
MTYSGKDAAFDTCTAKVASIARSSDKEAIAELFELVAAAAVTCDNRTEFVGRIMTMATENQMQMKGIIESSLARLSEYDSAAGGGGGGRRTRARIWSGWECHIHKR